MRASLVGAAVFVLAAVGVGLLRPHLELPGRGLRLREGAADHGVVREVDCDPCGEREWTGTWFLPRGGPTIFALEATGGGTGLLELDGQPLLRVSAAVPVDRQPVKERRVLAAGAHAVRIWHEGVGGQMRLFWLPPGRRGDPEYVPPEALRPVPPEKAGPLPHDLAYPADALAISAWLLLVLGLLLFLGRERLRAWRPARADLVCVAVVLAAAAGVRLFQLNAFGQTWDEDVYWSAGRNYLENLVHLDFRPQSWRWNYEHPPVAKYLIGLGALWHDGYGPARGIVAALGAGTCLLVFLIGRALFSREVGLGAGLLLAFLPPALAHSQIAGLETPSTFFATLAFHEFVRRRHLRAGLAGGLAVGCRFIAGLVFVGMALAALARRPHGRREWARLALAPVVGFLTLVLVWPRLWLEGPVTGLARSLMRLNVQHTSEWYWGRLILTPVPKSYFFVYFAACATPALLLGLALALPRLARRDRPALVCLAFVAAPFVVAFSPVIQSGVRYILPALPPAALLCAAGLVDAARWLRVPARAVLAVAAACSLLSCLSVRPYYLDYYNDLFGGPRAAFERRRFVFGWWGEGIAPVVDYVNRQAAPGARVYYNLFPNHIVWLDDHVRVVRTPAEAEWVLWNHFQFADPPAGLEEIFRVEVVPGAPLAAAYRRPGARPGKP